MGCDSVWVTSMRSQKASKMLFIAKYVSIKYYCTKRICIDIKTVKIMYAVKFSKNVRLYDKNMLESYIEWDSNYKRVR